MHTIISYGLDVSDRALRLVAIRQRKGNLPMLLNVAVVALASGILEHGVIQDHSLFVDALRGLIKTSRIKHRELRVGLPEAQTFVKLLSVPADPSMLTVEVIKELASQHLPFDLTNAAWSWELVGSINDEHFGLLVAIPKEVRDDLVSALAQVNCVAASLEPEALALRRAVLPANESPTPIGIIDLGRTRTGLVVVCGGCPAFSVSLPFSGDELTEELARTLQLTNEDAERLKLRCANDPNSCDKPTSDIFASLLEPLIGRLKESIVFAQHHLGESFTPTTYLLTGGGSHYHRLTELLGTALERPVIIADPFVNIDPKSIKPEHIAQAQSLSTAVGLALHAS